MDARDLHLNIDYEGEDSGWIPCYLTFKGVTHSFEASETLPPFRDLLDFLGAITLQRLPAWFYWDEEGYGLFFEAWPLGESTTDDCPVFHLRIIQEAYEHYWVGEGDDSHALVSSYKVLCVDDDLDREAVVDVFLAAVRAFVLYFPTPEDWRISVADLLSFEQLRARGVPPRCNIMRAEPVDLRLKRRQDNKAKSSSQRLELRMWGRVITGWELRDTSAFWPQWFALLEHALIGQPYKTGIYRMSATPLDHPRHFRLQIFEDNFHLRNFLILDEVLDAFQLASTFLDQFERLLENGYQSYPDEDGQSFDLRHLPVIRLRQLIERKAQRSRED